MFLCVRHDKYTQILWLEVNIKYLPNLTILGVVGKIYTIYKIPKIYKWLQTDLCKQGIRTC